jgi:tetratricopeptide (TPR) repeat protein
MKTDKMTPTEKPATTLAVSANLLPAAVLVALLSFAAFVPALGNDFVGWDDLELLVNHSHYRGLGWAELRWMFTTFHMGHYQPLTWISFAFDYLIWGSDPFGYHLTNIVLHAVNAALFFFVALLLLRITQPVRDRQSRFGIVAGSVVAGLLFSLHPLRVESVAWATERRDVLSGLFYLLALYSYLAAQTHADPNARRYGLITSIFVYALSLLAKSTGMTLPVVLVLLDVYPLRRLPAKPSIWLDSRYRQVWSEKLPFMLVAAISAIIALLAQQASGALRPVHQYFISYRLGQIFYSIWFYLWKSIFPTQLSPLYELPFDFAAWTGLFVLCAVVALAISAVLYFRRNVWPALFACWVYYLVVLAPVSGIAQSGPQLVADRYSYLSCLSWPLLFGGGLARLWILRARTGARHLQLTALTVAIASLALLGALTWRQSKVWQNSERLWQHAIAAAPASSIAQYNLARFYENDGNSERSLFHYRRAVENNPANADAQYNLARLLAKLGMESEAVAHYRAALAVRPRDADAHNNLGLLLARRGEADAAFEEFRRAVEIDPDYAKAYFNMGRLLVKRNELAPAIDHYHRALELHPNQLEIQLGLADALARQGRHEEAATHLRAVVEQRPGVADVHAALARVLSAQGRKNEAESHYRQALELLRLSQSTEDGPSVRRKPQ